MTDTEIFVIEHLAEYQAMVYAFDCFQAQIYYRVEEDAKMGVKTNPTYIVRLLDYAWKKGIEDFMPAEFAEHYLSFYQLKQILKQHDDRYDGK